MLLRSIRCYAPLVGVKLDSGDHSMNTILWMDANAMA
jgi:hypothetical protein